MLRIRKFIASALAFAVLAGTVGATAAIPGSETPFGITVSAAGITESGSCGENVTYTLDSDGTLTISGTGAMEDYRWYESPFIKSEINKVIIEDDVTSIGDHAFEFCSSLTSITIPDSVTSIGEYAFYYCTSLTDITIPDSVTSIRDSAFSDCSALESITIPDSVTSIGEYAFYGCTSLTDITIPDSVTSIRDYAFGWCESLGDITIPDSVTSIGDHAFDSCSSLTSITIPDSVTSIGDKAFGYVYVYVYDYDSEQYVKLPGFTIKGYNGTEAERYANDNEIEFIALGNTDIIDSGSCGENVSYTLDSEGTLTISGTGDMNNYEFGESPFYSDPNIKEIIIGNGITSIGSCAFMNCPSLTSVKLPYGVKGIGYGAFDDCTSLISINIPDGMTNIGTDAFCACDSLTNVSLPDSLTSISDHALGYYYDTNTEEYLKQPGFTIKGYEGSEAERYANDNGFRFIALGDEFIPGDVNGDGNADIADSLFVARADAGLATLSDAQKKAADVNGDGSADIADALFIARVDAGLAKL